jgi:hypothetical protein
MEQETWVSVKGWEGIYEVSNMGFAKRLAITTRNNIQMPERAMKYEVVDGGYLRVRFVKRPKYERYMVNRLVALHFIPNPLNKPEVNHKDGNKLNNAVWNLEWSTEKKNVNDAFAKGIKDNKKPKRPPVSKDLVLTIFNSPLSLKKLSIQYDLPKLTIQSIKSGKRHFKITGKQYNGKRA